MSRARTQIVQYVHCTADFCPHLTGAHQQQKQKEKKIKDERGLKESDCSVRTSEAATRRLGWWWWKYSVLRSLMCLWFRTSNPITVRRTGTPFSLLLCPSLPFLFFPPSPPPRPPPNGPRPVHPFHLVPSPEHADGITRTDVVCGVVRGVVHRLVLWGVSGCCPT